jgi:hypothetical protein
MHRTCVLCKCFYSSMRCLFCPDHHDAIDVLDDGDCRCPCPLPTDGSRCANKIIGGGHYCSQEDDVHNCRLWYNRYLDQFYKPHCRLDEEEEDFERYGQYIHLSSLISLLHGFSLSSHFRWCNSELLLNESVGFLWGSQGNHHLMLPLDSNR